MRIERKFWNLQIIWDSYGLSVQGAKSKCKGIIMLWVRFMAETCKSAQARRKSMLAPSFQRGCPMAEQTILRTPQTEKRNIRIIRLLGVYQYDFRAEKTECDVCVTSSSAVQICSKIENDKILFIPDPNLGRFAAEKLPEKSFVFYEVDDKDILLSAQKMSKKLEKHIRRHSFLFIRNVVRK